MRFAKAAVVRARDSFGAEQSWEGSRYRIPEERSPAAVAAAVAKHKPSESWADAWNVANSIANAQGSHNESDRVSSAAIDPQTGSGRQLPRLHNHPGHSLPWQDVRRGLPYHQSHHGILTTFSSLSRWHAA